MKKKILSFMLVISMVTSMIGGLPLNVMADGTASVVTSADKIIEIERVRYSSGDLINSMEAFVNEQTEKAVKQYSNDINYTESEAQKIMGDCADLFTIAADLSRLVPAGGELVGGILDICSGVSGLIDKSDIDKTQEMLDDMMHKIGERFDAVDEQLTEIATEIAETAVNESEYKEWLSSLEEDKKHLNSFHDQSGLYKYSGGYDGWKNELYLAHHRLVDYMEKNDVDTDDEQLCDYYDVLFKHSKSGAELLYDYIMDGKFRDSIQKIYYEYYFAGMKAYTGNSIEKITTDTISFMTDLYNTYQFATYCNMLGYMHYAEYLDNTGGYKYTDNNLEVYNYEIEAFFGSGDDEENEMTTDVFERDKKVKLKIVKDLTYLLMLDKSYMYSPNEGSDSYLDIPYEVVSEENNGGSKVTINFGTNISKTVYVKKYNKVMKNSVIYLNQIPSSFDNMVERDKLNFVITSGSANATVDNSGIVKVNGSSGSFTVAMKYDGSVLYSMNFEIGSNGFSGGYGDKYFPYLIKNADDLNAIRDNKDKHFMLVNDIDLTNYSFAPIGSFSGVLEGNGHTISGWSYWSDKVELEAKDGLIKSNSGIIRNLKIKDFNVYRSSSSRTAAGIGYVGILCGLTESGSLIENVVIEGSSVEVYVKANDVSHNTVAYAGAVAGKTHGTVRKCGVIECSIKGIARTGSQSGPVAFSEAGALTGKIEDGTMEDCYAIKNTVTVEAHCEATKNFWGELKNRGKAVARAGGITGMIQRGNFSRCIAINNNVPEPTVIMYKGDTYEEYWKNWKNEGHLDWYSGAIVGTSESPMTDCYSYNNLIDFNIGGVFKENGWLKNENGMPCFKIESNQPTASRIRLLETVGATSIEMVSLPIYEYACREYGADSETDSESMQLMETFAWQDTAEFENLKPNTTYEIFVRSKETNLVNASEVSTPIIITTEKHKAEGEAIVPVIKTVTNNSVTLEKVEGYDYSKDGKSWQKSNAFNYLEEGVEYTFYQRISETDTHFASEKSAGVTAKTKVSVTVKGLGDEDAEFVNDTFDGKIVVVLYDELGQAVFVKTYAPEKTITPDIANVAYKDAKVLWWLSVDSMKPLFEAVVIK